MCLLLVSQGDSPTPDTFSDEGGYYKFPNGLIFQFGSFANKPNPFTGNFPIVFPHSCISLNVTTSRDDGYPVAFSYNKSSYIIGLAGGTGSWFAIGY